MIQKSCEKPSSASLPRVSLPWCPSVWKTRYPNPTRAAFLLFVTAGVGCMRPHRTNFQVPVACIEVTADSFTGPCNQRRDGKIVCDRVVVTASCIQAGK